MSKLCILASIMNMCVGESCVLLVKDGWAASIFFFNVDVKAFTHHMSRTGILNVATIITEILKLYTNASLYSLVRPLFKLFEQLPKFWVVFEVIFLVRIDCCIQNLLKFDNLKHLRRATRNNVLRKNDWETNKHLKKCPISWGILSRSSYSDLFMKDTSSITTILTSFKLSINSGSSRQFGLFWFLPSCILLPRWTVQ